MQQSQFSVSSHVQQRQLCFEPLVLYELNTQKGFQ